MKLNIACPATGGQKTIEIDDEKKLRPLYDKRIAHEINGEEMSEEFRGYIFRITGGNDLQGFPMMQGVLTNNRVRLLLKTGSKCFRPRRAGEKKRKSIRGCIVSADLSVLNLTVVKKGEQEIEGVTDVVRPRRRGPKRVTRIRKLFNLDKEDDVRKFVIRRPVTKGDKTFTKAPKIQRLVTPQRLQRKRRWAAIKRARWEKAKADAEEYQVLLARRQQELKEKRQKRRESRRSTAAA